MAEHRIRDTFNKRFFDIPKYQRGFAWEKHHIRELYEDIIESIETSSEHYLGTLVLSKNPLVDDHYYIVGAGSTTRSVMELLGLNGSLLGVDIVYRGQMICRDVGEAEILKTIRGKKTKIIITPIGGQGYLFGRGNQQISPAVLSEVGKENIIVIATKQKIHSLHGQPLLVDTGDEKVDLWLSDHIKVITGYHESIIYRVSR